MDLKTILKRQVDSIVKFVNELYSPYDYWVMRYDDPERYSIIFYFEDIDDRYITNPHVGNIREHKENVLRREIRKEIYDLLNIRTSGVQPPDFFSPEEKHPITIYVKHTG